MKKNKKTTLLLIAFTFISNYLISQNTVCFTIESNTNTGLAFSGFSKYVNVLDCFDVYAESSITDEKVLHAAAVAAELLDNNEDGIVDDPLLEAELTLNDALIPIFTTDGSVAENNFFNYYNGNGAAAVLYNNEMNPYQPGYWGSDATVEEVIHVINAIGHTNIYPSAFTPSPNSSLMSAAMDVARGGQFLSVPASYPAAAWYHYDDVTCDFQCMAIEYMYWSIVSLMGILDDPTTCTGIANEWEPCSPTLFQSTDTLMYNLITDPQYSLPQLAPDGNYCPAGMSIIKNNIDPIYLYPNPSNGVLQINSANNKINCIEIFNTQGVLIDRRHPGITNPKVNLEQLSNGVYFISIDNTNNRKIIINK